MELIVKFVDYGNEISVSKVYPCCGRSVASAVWSQKRPAAEKLLSDSTDVGGMLFKASSRRTMFVVRWPVASKRLNSFARCLFLFSFMGVTLSVSITLMAASDCLGPRTPWQASWINVSVSDAFCTRLRVRNPSQKFIADRRCYWSTIVGYSS